MVEKNKDRFSKLIIFAVIGIILVFILESFNLIPFGPFPIITLIILGAGIFILTRVLAFSKEEKQLRLEDFFLLAIALAIVVGYFLLFPEQAFDFSTLIARPTLSVIGVGG